MNDTKDNDNINGCAMSSEDPLNVIARLLRKLENFQLIIESQDKREMEVMTRSEGEAALIDELQRQAALNRDALNVYREELRVFPCNAADFMRVLVERRSTIHRGIDGLISFVNRYASIPEATPGALEAIAKMLSLIQRVNLGKGQTLPKMPSGGDINEINLWVRDMEHAGEDHEEDRTRTDIYGHEVTIPAVEEEWMAKAEDSLKRRFKEFRDYCRRTNEKLAEMKEPNITADEVEAVTGCMNNGGLPLYCADCIRERRHEF